MELDSVRTFDFSLPSCRENMVDSLVEISDKLESGDLSFNEIVRSNAFLHISKPFDEKNTLLSNNRTSRLWLQYMDMVTFFQQFLAAERTGDWKQHLMSLSKM